MSDPAPTLEEQVIELQKQLKESQKQMKDSTKTTDELKGKLERQKNLKQNSDKDKDDLREIIAKYKVNERKSLEAKVLKDSPKFKITKDMSDAYLNGYLARSVVDERGSPPPKIPSGESTGEITLTDKQKMIAQLLS